jgi:hypothetical protein
MMTCILLLISLLLWPGWLVAAQAQLTWTAPTTNMNGSPLTDLARFHVYPRVGSGSYGAPINTGLNPYLDISALVPGETYHWVVTALNTAGHESPRSNEATMVVAAVTPPATASYATGSVCFTWTRGAYGMQADHLNVRCGVTPGGRNLPVKTIPVPLKAPDPPNYCILIRDLLAQPASFPANYYCAARSAQGASESQEESPELFFSVTAAELAAPTASFLKP